MGVRDMWEISARSFFFFWYRLKTALINKVLKKHKAKQTTATKVVWDTINCLGPLKGSERVEWSHLNSSLSGGGSASHFVQIGGGGGGHSTASS